MKPVARKDIIGFVEHNIGRFHEQRLESVRRLDLKKILKNRNPYLAKAKNTENAHDFVKGVVDAYLALQEVTMFGYFLEELAIFACQKAYCGRKSASEGMDLEFEKDDVYYIVSVKSSPNWGNADAVKKLRENFKTIKRRLRANPDVRHVIAINGCCTGKSGKKYDKGDYLKICGQAFWTFISGDPDLYADIVEPVGYRAKERNEIFKKECDLLVNRATKSFMSQFCLKDGSIDWQKLVRHNAQDDLRI